MFAVWTFLLSYTPERVGHRTANGRCVTVLYLRLQSRMANVAALKGDSLESYTPPPTPKYPLAIYWRCTQRRAPHRHTHTYSHTTKYLNTLKGLSLRLCVVNRALCKLQMVNEAGSEDRREEGWGRKTGGEERPVRWQPQWSSTNRSGFVRETEADRDLSMASHPWRHADNWLPCFGCRYSIFEELCFSICWWYSAIVFKGKMTALVNCSST